MKQLFITIMIVFSGLVAIGCGGGGSNPASPIVTPRIVSISPTSGGSGTQVSIQGSGFGNVQGASVLSYAGMTVIPNSWSDTLIMATIPSSALNDGPFLVTVNGQYSNASTIFTLGSPQITSINPTSGAPGSVVYISGTGFGSLTNDSRVGFNGQAASIQSWSNTMITCLVPTMTNTQSGNVSVVVWLNSSKYSNAFTFNVSVPKINSVTPTTCSIGSILTITGQGFGAFQSQGFVTIGGQSTSIQGWGDLSITCKIPSSLTAGTLSVIVTANSQQSNSYYVTISAPLINGVTNVTNSSNLPSKDERALISGDFFGTSATEGPGTISIGGSAPLIYSWSKTAIEVRWPVSNDLFGTQQVNVSVTVGGLTTTVSVTAE